MRTFLLVVASLFWSCLALAASDELAMRQKIARQVEALWKDRAAEDLARLGDELRETRKRTRSGIWKLSVFNSSLEDQISSDDASGRSWESQLTEMERLANEYPKSPVIQMLPARSLMKRAWIARGNRFASEVPEANLAEFRRLMQLADSSLQSIKAVASIDPTWYELSLGIATYTGKTRREAELIFAEGVSREPGFYQLYFAMSRYYDPKWGGSAEALEEFIIRAISPLTQRERDSMYLRLYWWAADLGYFAQLTDSKVDCKRLVRGAKLVEEEFPDPWNINNLAKLAGRCGDRSATKYFLDKIGDKPLPQVWGTGSEGAANFERFKAWATQ